jgi:HlyD family secretion protein
MARNLNFFIAASLVLPLALLTSCGKGADAEKEKAGAEPAVNVLVETANRGAIDHMVIADAVLYPVNQANIASKITAPVKRTLVSRGDHVRAGQVLLELESEDLAAAARETQQQYEQSQAAFATVRGATAPEDQSKAQSDVQVAEQMATAAQKLYDNRVALQKEGALAQKLVDDAKVALAQAQGQLVIARRHLEAVRGVSNRETIRSSEAQMNAAKAHYDNAALQVSYAQVRSPINGIISDRPVLAGELPASGTPIISVVDISQVVARANVPLKDASAIKPGRPARITGPDGDIPAKVTVVSPTVDPNTTTVEVWVQAANPGEKLKPGGTVRVAIIAETIQDTIIVPSSALLNSDDGTPKVMIVTADNKARERRVSVGVRQGKRVQIISGLQEGDKVVTSGGLGLEDKAKVVIQQPKPEDEDEDKNSDDEAKPDPAAKPSPAVKDDKGKK